MQASQEFRGHNTEIRDVVDYFACCRFEESLVMTNCKKVLKADTSWEVRKPGSWDAWKQLAGKEGLAFQLVLKSGSAEELKFKTKLEVRRQKTEVSRSWEARKRASREGRIVFKELMAESSGDRDPRPASTSPP